MFSQDSFYSCFKNISTEIRFSSHIFLKILMKEHWIGSWSWSSFAFYLKFIWFNAMKNKIIFLMLASEIVKGFLGLQIKFFLTLIIKAFWILFKRLYQHLHHNWESVWKAQSFFSCESNSYVPVFCQPAFLPASLDKFTL